MQGGDIGSFAVFRVYCVWEDTIAVASRQAGGLLNRIQRYRRDADVQWEVLQSALESLLDLQRHNVAINVVTFTNEETAEHIRQTLSKLAPDLMYADVEYYDIGDFGRMLSLTADVKYVIDSNHGRANLWGWRSFYVQRGGRFNVIV